MTQIQKYISNSPLADLKSSVQNFISAYADKYSDVLEALSRHATPFGGNLVEKGHDFSENVSENSKPKNIEASENRYSVLYTLNNQYHHLGCSSQAEAQSLMGMLMTDGNRIPVGIYDAKADSFEWEIIGQYFHSQDAIDDQQRRHEEVLTISRAIRRRDSSWQAGYLQKPSFFA